MMIDPTFLFFAAPAPPTGAASTGHPYRTAPEPRAFDPDSARVPYDGQTRMRLAISSGLAHARIVIDPAARDLLAVVCGDGPRPRIQLAGGELAVSWQLSFGERLRDAFTGLRDVAIVLHPAVEWTVACRALSHAELDLSAGTIARLDIAGGCSHVRLDLPAPPAVVPVRIAGGASHLDVRRPAETGVSLGVAGGIATLRLDDQSLDAIGGGAQLGTGDVSRTVPHYDLTITGGASDLSIARR